MLVSRQPSGYNLLVIALVVSTTTLFIEVSATPLLKLGDVIVTSRKCTNQECSQPQQFFNTSSCQCECENAGKHCGVGYQIFNSDICDCQCPTDKVKSICRHDGTVYDNTRCDCVKERKTRQESSMPVPPPPPPPPPPPAGLCSASTNCTALKVFNQTSCECECFQYLPADDCPVPTGSTKGTTKPFDTNKYDYVIGDDGCKELTPKGKRYKKVRKSKSGSKKGRRPRAIREKRRHSKGSKGTKGTKSKKATTLPPTTPPRITTPTDTCPAGQVANPSTCECMRL